MVHILAPSWVYIILYIGIITIYILAPSWVYILQNNPHRNKLIRSTFHKTKNHTKLGTKSGENLIYILMGVPLRPVFNTIKSSIELFGIFIKTLKMV